MSSSPFTLTMPKLSPTMETGTIASWQKKEGDFVESGDVLFEVATDKATVEYSAIDSGWLRKIIVHAGEEAAVNQAVAVFTEGEKESIKGYKPDGMVAEKAAVKEEEPKTQAAVAETPKARSAAQASAMAQPVFAPEAPLASYAFEYPTETAGKRLPASPLAKKLAKEKGLDLTTVKGSGPHKRIVSKDLEKAQPAGTIAFGHRELPRIAPGTYEEEVLTPIRKIIGQRLQESKTFIPHFYVQQTIDAEPLAAAREQLKQGDLKISVNDFVVRAVALALRKHPEINSGFSSVNQSIIRFKTVDVAIAVSMENGLITPIVRHADYKNLGELAVEIRLLAQRARDGKLEPHEYKGGSFTISNLGMYGVTDFQAILNPPQAAILAVSAIQEAAAVKNGVVVPGKVMNITLSVDHRVIDGAAAAQFLRSLKHLLENPSLLIVS